MRAVERVSRDASAHRQDASCKGHSLLADDGFHTIHVVEVRDSQKFETHMLLIQPYFKGMGTQPCVRFILVIGLQLIELPDSVLESDRQR